MAAKTALVTGCSAGGIGHGLAAELARRGVHVFATARNLSKMSDLDKASNITLLTLDVTSPSSIAAAVAAVKEKTGGRLDYLVSNSGGGDGGGPILDLDLAKSKAMFDVNLWGFIAVIQAFAPLVIAAKGMFVNISSIASLLHAPWMATYSASKSAMDLVSETLRHEVEPLGVKVQTVVTGAVKTQFFNNVEVEPMPKGSYFRAAEEEIGKRKAGADVFGFASVEDYAKSVVNDILGGKSGHTYRGKFATMIRILGALLPQFIYDGIANNGTGLDKMRKSAATEIKQH